MNSRYFAPPRPRLFAHRGASAHYPENTIPAFAAAVQAGIPYLEMDVWATRDGVVMVHHDETLDRLCGFPRRLADFSLPELLELDAGNCFTADGGKTFPHRGRGIVIPTLSSVLAAFPEAFCNIEIKQDAPAIEKQVLETVRRADARERVLLAAEKDAVMARLRPLCDGIPTSLSMGEVAAFFDWFGRGRQETYRPPGAALQIPASWGGRTLVTPETVAAAHEVRMEVHVWTVNAVEEMKRLLAMGVDGVMSDYPERLTEVAG